MRKQILFIHSAGDQGNQNGSCGLVAYIKDHLSADFDVMYPKMPDPENPRYLLWKNHVAKQMSLLQGDVIVIGHSLGGSVVMKYLAECGFRIRILGLFLIAIPYWDEDGWNIDEFLLPDNFEEKLSQIPNVFLYHSHKDAWVPFSHLETFIKKMPYAVGRPIQGEDHEFSKGLEILVRDIKNLSYQSTL